MQTQNTPKADRAYKAVKIIIILSITHGIAFLGGLVYEMVISEEDRIAKQEEVQQLIEEKSLRTQAEKDIQNLYLVKEIISNTAEAENFTLKVVELEDEDHWGNEVLEMNAIRGESKYPFKVGEVVIILEHPKGHQAIPLGPKGSKIIEDCMIEMTGKSPREREKILEKREEDFIELMKENLTIPA